MLQIELDECQKKRQQLQHEFDEATQEDSKFGVSELLPTSLQS